MNFSRVLEAIRVSALIVPLSIFAMSVSIYDANALQVGSSSITQEELDEASHGSADAQFALAYKYENGIGVPKDISAAVKWYQKSSQQGEPRAHYYLACLYEEGRGVAKDYQMAKELFEKASKQPWYGQYLAYNKLGKLYFKGLGTKPNITKALDLWERASNTSEEARLMLGCVYYYGRGVSKDYNKAIDWWNRGDGGEANQNYLRGVLAAEGRHVRQSYTKAAQLWQIAANNGDLNAQIALGDLFFNGNGVKQDFKQATFWLSLAARHSKTSPPQASEELSQAASKINSQQHKLIQEQLESWSPAPTLRCAEVR